MSFIWIITARNTARTGHTVGTVCAECQVARTIWVPDGTYLHVLGARWHVPVRAECQMYVPIRSGRKMATYRYVLSATWHVPARAEYQMARTSTFWVPDSTCRYVPPESDGTYRYVLGARCHVPVLLNARWHVPVRAECQMELTSTCWVQDGMYRYHLSARWYVPVRSGCRMARPVRAECQMARAGTFWVPGGTSDIGKAGISLG